MPLKKGNPAPSVKLPAEPGQEIEARIGREKVVAVVDRLCRGAAERGDEKDRPRPPAERGEDGHLGPEASDTRQP